MAKPKQSKPKPYLHVPIQRSSSVSASPINSNLKSLREWANFRWAAERPRKKDVMMTWVLVLSRGLEDIYSSSGWHSCRALLLSTCEEAQANSSAEGPAPATRHSLRCVCLPLCTLARSRCRGNVYSSLRLFFLRDLTILWLVPYSTFPSVLTQVRTSEFQAVSRNTHPWWYLPGLREIFLADKAQCQAAKCS